MGNMKTKKSTRTQAFNFFTQPNLFAIAFLLLFASLIWMFYFLLKPFFSIFMWALILALVFYPLYDKINRLLGRRPNAAAALVAIFVMLLLALPGFFILLNLGEEASKTYEMFSATSWDEKSGWIIEKIREKQLDTQFQKWGLDPAETLKVLQDAVAKGLRDLSGTLLVKVTDVLKHIPIFFLKVCFMAVALFFFFRDGAHLSRKIIELLPMSPSHQKKVTDTFSTTVMAVVRATFITAATQGVLAGTGFAVAGVPFPILLGMATSVTSCIPILGAASVWVPSVIYLIVQEHFIAAFLLALWSFFVVSTVDNILKPLIIGAGGRLPIFLVFFTILGGLKAYGVIGIFLGPIILSMGLAFLSIYKELYLNPSPARAKHR
jgi:predicted PurR-regulated permease PerM